MPRDRTADPWGGATHHGFSSLTEPCPRPGRGPMRTLSRKHVIGGVAAAVGLGLAFGLAARPDVGQHARRVVPMQPATRASTGTIPIEVVKPAVRPAPKPTTRLEVLPPEMARGATPPATAAPRSEQEPFIEPDGRALDEKDVDEPNEVPDDAPG
jgi:hypothetical protein